MTPSLFSTGSLTASAHKQMLSEERSKCDMLSKSQLPSAIAGGDK